MRTNHASRLNVDFLDASDVVWRFYGCRRQTHPMSKAINPPAVAEFRLRLNAPLAAYTTRNVTRRIT
jgi:hypothetical protein